MLTDFGLRAYESNPLTSMFFPPFSLSRLICEGFFVVFFFSPLSYFKIFKA